METLIVSIEIMSEIHNTLILHGALKAYYFLFLIFVFTNIINI